MVKLLVENGADVQHKTEYTALQLAEMAEQDTIVSYLKSLYREVFGLESALDSL